MNIEKCKYLGLIAAFAFRTSMSASMIQAEEGSNFSTNVECDYHNYPGDDGMPVIESHPQIDINGENLSPDVDYVINLFNLTRRTNLTETYSRPRHGHLMISYHPEVPGISGRVIPLWSGDSLFINISGSDGNLASYSVILPVC